jgi:hypothetical protein
MSDVSIGGTFSGLRAEREALAEKIGALEADLLAPGKLSADDRLMVEQMRTMNNYSHILFERMLDLKRRGQAG